jgi:hypothetical protein
MVVTPYRIKVIVKTLSLQEYKVHIVLFVTTFTPQNAILVLGDKQCSFVVKTKRTVSQTKAN